MSGSAKESAQGKQPPARPKTRLIVDAGDGRSGWRQRRTMVFFFYAGNGAQGALVSVAVSAGLMLLQRGAPEHLVPLLTCGLVIAAVAAPTQLHRTKPASPACRPLFSPPTSPQRPRTH